MKKTIKATSSRRAGKVSAHTSRLVLQREVIRELSPRALVEVGGAWNISTDPNCTTSTLACKTGE